MKMQKHFLLYTAFISSSFGFWNYNQMPMYNPMGSPQYPGMGMQQPIMPGQQPMSPMQGMCPPMMPMYGMQQPMMPACNQMGNDQINQQPMMNMPVQPKKQQNVDFSIPAYKKKEFQYCDCYGQFEGFVGSGLDSVDSTTREPSSIFCPKQVEKLIKAGKQAKRDGKGLVVRTKYFGFPGNIYNKRIEFSIVEPNLVDVMVENERLS